MDFALVRHALNLAKKTGMDEVDLELGDSKFHAVFDEKGQPSGRFNDATGAAVDTTSAIMRSAPVRRPGSRR